MPGKNHVFTTRVDPDSPPLTFPHRQTTDEKWNWWRRRVPPPGPQRLFHMTFIAIAGCYPAFGI